MDIYALHFYIGYVNFVLALFLNLILLYMVRYHTRVAMGSYRYLLYLIATYQIVYSSGHATLSPVVYNTPSLVFVFIDGALVRSVPLFVAQLLQVYMEAIYAACMIILTLHFVYRYVHVCEKRLMFLFNTPMGVLLVTVASSFLIVLWAVVAWIFYNPSAARAERIREIMSNHFGMDSKKMAYSLIQYKIINPTTGQEEWSTPDIIGMLIIGMISVICFTLIIFCGYFTYAEFSRIQMTLSKKVRELQQQLFRSLLVLSLVPLVTIYAPCLVVFYSPVFGIGVYDQAMWLQILGSLNPVIDPIVLIYFLGDYRRVFISKFTNLLYCRSLSTNQVYGTQEVSSKTQNRETKKTILAQSEKKTDSRV